MTLIKSISGIRATIGGPTGDTLNPLDIVKFTTAYAKFIRQSDPTGSNCIVVGRDARISGDMVRLVVCGTLIGMGYDVLDIGLATTPTTELAVRMSHAAGGIIVTASHNPRQWNALKLLNHEGEFLTKDDGNAVLAMAEKEDFDYADVDHIGTYPMGRQFRRPSYRGGPRPRPWSIRRPSASVDSGSSLILSTPSAASSCRSFSTDWASATPSSMARPMATSPIIRSRWRRTWGGIMGEVAAGGYDLGIVVDPDVDRLAFIQEDGKMYGEEYTLVSLADYILDHVKGATVSNLSSTRALRDVTERHGAQYFASAVGEVNVTTKMKEVGAVIGGEGNGGVIYPESHYCRDALVGIALFLSSLAQKGLTCSELRKTFPTYYIAKNRIDLTPDTDMDAILGKVKERFGSMDDVRVTDIDGVKLDFPTKWVHLRKSNTEPIMRVYSEAATMEEADAPGQGAHGRGL